MTRSLICPLCGTTWKVESNGTGNTETAWITCDTCLDDLPQRVHDSDDEGEIPDEGA